MMECRADSTAKAAGLRLADDRPPLPRYDRFGPAGPTAREDRHSGGEGLEMDVAEGLVEGGQRHHVGCGIQSLDVGSRRAPGHAVAHAQALGQESIRLRPAPPRDEQPRAPVAKPRQALDERTEPFALDARAD